MQPVTRVLHQCRLPFETVATVKVFCLQPAIAGETNEFQHLSSPTFYKPVYRHRYSSLAGGSARPTESNTNTERTQIYICIPHAAFEHKIPVLRWLQQTCNIGTIVTSESDTHTHTHTLTLHGYKKTFRHLTSSNKKCINQKIQQNQESLLPIIFKYLQIYPILSL
jgi:hypothetical protein